MKKLIKRLLGCPKDRSLILVWKVKEAEHALGQIETTTRISVGRYKLFSWTTVFTPLSEWKS